jgi:hypothetical protein
MVLDRVGVVHLRNFCEAGASTNPESLSSIAVWVPTAKTPLRRRHKQAVYWLSIAGDCLAGTTSQSVYVLGYIRSGTSWLALLLSSALEMPVLEASKQSWPQRGPCVFQLHRFIPLDSVRRRTIYVLRDGRDAIISSYFHVVRQAGLPIKRRVERRLGREVRADNIRENLPGFIRFMQTNRIYSMDYRSHVEEWLRHRQKYVTVRYEKLLKEPIVELSRVLLEVRGEAPNADVVSAAVAKNSFATLTARAIGVEDPDSFWRKGVEGDWRAYFSPESGRLFDAYAGDLLVELGYESNREWAFQLKTSDDAGG